MKWRKKGLICSRETVDLPWFRKNIMVPVPHRLNDAVLRIFVTLCDENNIGRIGYVDVEAANPSAIVAIGAKPTLDLGEAGAFDDHGVVTASVVENADALWLYYSGYHMVDNPDAPYTIFSGLAVSSDGGVTAARHARNQILQATPGEPYSRCAPIVERDGHGGFRMWYTGDYGNGWKKNADGKALPWYLIKRLDSPDGVNWGDSPGEICLDWASDDEHGLAKPTVWQEDGLYKMLYSIRTFSKGYRLGYAESRDGTHFERKDDLAGIDVSESGWDSEMVCFASRIECDGRIFLFYCGNRYGLGGMGYAELERA